MALILCRGSITTITSNKRDEVYIAATPLRGPGAVPQFLISSLKIFNLQHFMVIINPSSSPSNSDNHDHPLVFDFQPRDPEDLSTALAALSGRKVPGIIRERKLIKKKLPERNCWFVGYSSETDAAKAVEKFNGKWDTDLRIGYHDCRNYVCGLVQYLTGHTIVLENLTSHRR